MAKNFIHYLWFNRLVTALGCYFLFSIILYSRTGIDICIPCLWKTLFGWTCPGCGISTATMRILEFNFAGAYQANGFVFVVLPGLMYYGIQDFRKFSGKKSDSPNA
jgi:hypothetical protein